MAKHTRKPGPVKPKMAQTTIRLLEVWLTDADEIVVERGYVCDRSDVLREAMAIGFQELNKRRSKT